MTDTSRDVAQAQLVALQAELVSAERELSNWFEHDKDRRDGSDASDQRHENRRLTLESREHHAREKVKAQERVIADLEAKSE